MAQHAISRIIWAVPMLFLLSVLTFLLMHAVPGGPFATDKPVPRAIQQNHERKFRLDQPLWRQYGEYVLGVIRHWDFGPSYTSTTRDVREIIGDHLPVSAQLAGLAIGIGVLIGLPVGAFAAANRNTFLDYALTSIVVLGLAIPAIILGPLLVWGFALKLNWLPVATWGTAKHMVLPAVTLGLPLAALLARMTRASLLQVLQEDYIRTAMAKGLGYPTIIVRHAMPIAIIPVATYLGPLFAVLITGSLVVEQIFAVPGLAGYFISSIGNRDYPVIMATTLLVGTLIILANLVVDILYVLIDPRLRRA